MINEKKLIESVKAYKELGLGRNLHSIAEVIIEIIESQPKVGEWIPVEERLPKEQTDYKGIKRSYCSLVTVIGYGIPIIDIDYTVNGIWRLEEANTVLKVIAWQPLPEPYRVPLEKNSKKTRKNSKGETE